jgi:hypothetical protein
LRSFATFLGMESGPACACKRYFDKCPELPAVFVVVMKNQRRSE